MACQCTYERTCDYVVTYGRIYSLAYREDLGNSYFKQEQLQDRSSLWLCWILGSRKGVCFEYRPSWLFSLANEMRCSSEMLS